MGSVLASTGAQAQSFTWEGVNSDWHAAENWSGGTVPGVTDNAIIQGAAGGFLSTAENVDLGSIEFDTGASAVQMRLGADLSVSGLTTVTSGSVELGDGETAVAIELNGIVNEGDLTFNNAGSTTLLGSITGSGDWSVKTGTLLLDANNLSTGKISIGKDAVVDLGIAGTLGASSIELDGSLNINEVNGYFIDGELSGTGHFTLGMGAAVLNADNSFSGTITTVEGSSLYVGFGAETGSLGTAAVDHGGHITINLTRDIVVENDIYGEGSLDVAGTGKVTLAGKSTYSGSTAVMNGTLEAGEDFASTGQLSIFPNATFQGHGRFGGANFHDFGRLRLLSEFGNMSFEYINSMPQTVFEYDFGNIGTALNPGIGSNAVIEVADNLNLNGQLVVSRGFDTTPLEAGGYYRLMTFGTLVGSGLVINSMPTIAGMTGAEVQYGDSYVDLLIRGADPMELQHWIGGSGVWNPSTEWLDVDSNFQPDWAGNTAVFKHNVAGINEALISVMGSYNVGGLQFVDDGFHLYGGHEGSSLVLGADGHDAEVRVLADVATISGLYSDDFITGTGGLLKTGSGTLQLYGVNSYSGGTGIASGTLEIVADESLGSGDLAISNGTLKTTVSFDMRRNVSLTDVGTFETDISTTLTHFGSITGPGTLLKTGMGTLSLGGANSYGKTIVAMGSLSGDAASISGDISNAGTVAFIQNTDGEFAGSISGYKDQDGSMIKFGAGRLTLGGASSLDWIVSRGELSADASRFLGDASIDTNATLILTGAYKASFAHNVRGTGNLHVNGDGDLAFTGDNSAFAGRTRVLSGIFDLTGSLGGHLSVENGAALKGVGKAGIVDVTNGGSLIGQAGEVLTMDSLRLNSGAQIEAVLGSTAAGALFDVTGDLELAGTVNVTAGETLGAGVYRLFNYGGTLTGYGLAIGTVPSGIDASNFSVQVGEPGRVNLLSSIGVELTFWDGGNASQGNNHVIDGGSGIWTANSPSWTSSDGAYNGALKPADFAIFQGAAGSVILNNAAGKVSAGGLQFATDGYELTAGQLDLEGASGRTVIRVGDGSVDSANMTARIGSNMVSAGDLVKTDGGTLILDGDNTYRNTIVESGTLVGNAGSIAGNIENAGTVVFDQAGSGTVTGAITGTSGKMVKRGTGSLTLANTSELDWSVEDGSLAADVEMFAGNASIANGANLTLTGDAGSVYSGKVSGDGRLVLAGEGNLTLTGDNSAFAGSTIIVSGSLDLGGKLGGHQEVLSGASLTGTGTAGNVRVAAGGALVGKAGDVLSMDELTLIEGSQIDVTLGSPSSAALFNITGDLELAGKLNVSDSGTFGAGIYRLFEYGGELTNNGMIIDGLPAGVNADDLSLQVGILGRVNLVSSIGAELTFWDGSDASNQFNGFVDGGNGTWSANSRTWTGADGVYSGALNPNPAFAVFQGDAGTVSLDNSDGKLAVTGLQFATGGYRLVGDELSLEGNDEQTLIRVGDGSADSAGMTTTIDSALISDGDLVKGDAGTLILNGANTYRNTIVDAGTIIGSASSIRGSIANAGKVIFDQAANNGFAGDVTGYGSDAGLMVKRGAGNLTLTGHSDLDWSIEAGSLITEASRFLGDADISEDAELQFQQNGAGIYAGSLTGSGNVSIEGSADFLLTGDSSGFTGTVEVLGSNLVSTGKLGGTLLVGDGSAVSGNGRFGNVSVLAGGKIAPASYGDQLRVNDIEFAEGSILEISVDPIGTQSSRIVATGQATLNGGSVVHIGAGGAYSDSSAYTIISAMDGVTGEFAEVTSDFAFLTPVLGYTEKLVTLSLTRNDTSFGWVSNTINQKSVASMIEFAGRGNSLYEAVLPLSADGAVEAFDMMTGEIHASLQSALVNDSRGVRMTALDRMRLAGAGIDSERGTTWWMEGLGNWGHLDGGRNGETHRIKHSSKGVLMGVDAIAANAFQFGLYGGWKTSDFDMNRVSSDAEVDSGHVGIYAGMDLDNLSLRSGLGYSWHNASVTRRIDFDGFSDVASSKRDGSTKQSFAEVGYRSEVAGVSVEPFAGVTHVDVDLGTVREDGGAAALTIDRSSMNVTYSSLGAGLTKAFALGGIGVDLRSRLAWNHSFGDDMPVSRAAFEGGESFEINGAPISKNEVSVDAGLGLSFSKRARLDVSYSGNIGSRTQYDSAKATLSIAF